MSIRYAVQQGDCIESIAHAFGFFPETIWNHSANASLKNLRQYHTVLMPGDIVIIPDRQLKEEIRPTGARHRFRRKGVPTLYTVQLLDDDDPRAYVEYTFECMGKIVEGETNDEGWVVEWIPPDAVTAKLTMHDNGTLYEIEFGRLDPVTEESGLRARLINLGYMNPATAREDDSDPVGDSSQAMSEAICAFQRDYGLDPTGVPDAVLHRMMVNVYGV